MNRYSTFSQHGKTFIKDANTPGVLMRPEEVAARLNAQENQREVMHGALVAIEDWASRAALVQDRSAHIIKQACNQIASRAKEAKGGTL